MKKIILVPILILAFFFRVQAQGDAIERFFSKYMEDERFSRVFISPKMMQMAGGFLKNNAANDKESAELGALISKVKGIRILSSDQVDGMRLYKEVMGTLAKNEYEELMDVQDKGTSLKFLVKEESGRVRELLMLTGDQSSFTLLSMQGSFSYSDLNMLADKTNMPGMEEYGKGSKGPKGPK